jgi:hypothetical protein
VRIGTFPSAAPVAANKSARPLPLCPNSSNHPSLFSFPPSPPSNHPPYAFFAHSLFTLVRFSIPQKPSSSFREPFFCEWCFFTGAGKENGGSALSSLHFPPLSCEEVIFLLQQRQSNSTEGRSNRKKKKELLARSATLALPICWVCAQRTLRTHALHTLATHAHTAHAPALIPRLREAQTLPAQI